MFQLRLTRRYFWLSPNEMAFSRFRAARAMRRAGFVEISIKPFDFLHPATPPDWIEPVARLSGRLERLPLLRELAGSMLISCRKA
jgi:hypothetical protein